MKHIAVHKTEDLKRKEPQIWISDQIGLVNITFSKAHSAIIIHLREIKYFQWWTYIVKFEVFLISWKRNLTMLFNQLFPLYMPEK